MSAMIDHRQDNIAIHFQFQLGERPGGTQRDTWDEAARDAVNLGYAIWRDAGSILLDNSHGARIKRLVGRPIVPSNLSGAFPVACCRNP